MRVAFLGLGIMGSRMAANLAAAGFELTVWNRTSVRAEAFAAAHPGVTIAKTPAEGAARAELVVTMVVDGDQVRELLLEGSSGAVATATPGTLFVDCSTIGIDAARELAFTLREQDCRFLDAPVTGSSPAAEAGTLVFMVGGEREDFELAHPVLSAMGTRIVYAGPSGQGQAVKVINNAVAAANATTLGQALLLARRLGTDLEALTEVLENGSGKSTMVDLKARTMARHDYTTLFKLDHMLKDVRLCLASAADADAEFPMAAAGERALAVGSELGFGDVDFAALIEGLEAMAGFRL